MVCSKGVSRKYHFEKETEKANDREDDHEERKRVWWGMEREDGHSNFRKQGGLQMIGIEGGKRTPPSP